MAWEQAVSTVSQQPKAGSLIKLIEVLQQIDTSSPNAEINAQSIDDNNGGRITL